MGLINMLAWPYLNRSSRDSKLLS